MAVSALDYGPPVAATKDTTYYRQVGTSPIECWYSANDGTAAYVARTTLVNTMFAFPFISTRGGTLDRIGMSVAVGCGAGGVMRLGIYSATSTTNLYPNSLLLDSGALVTTGTGTVSATISQALAANTFYWFVSLAGVDVTGTFSGFNGNNFRPVLGSQTPGGNSQFGISVAQAYGALPATFTAGGAALTALTNPVAVFVRYSA